MLRIWPFTPRARSNNIFFFKKKQDCKSKTHQTKESQKHFVFQTALGFEAHQDTMRRSGSTAKNRYVV